MIYDVIQKLVVLIKKLAFFNKQLFIRVYYILNQTLLIKPQSQEIRSVNMGHKTQTKIYFDLRKYIEKHFKELQ